MSQITKIDLGVPVLKDSIDLGSLNYVDWSDLGWDAGYSTFDIPGSEIEDYLHQDLVDLLEFELDFLVERLSIMKLSPGFQTCTYVGDIVSPLIQFNLSQGILFQSCDPTGYTLVKTTKSPQADNSSWGKLILRPGMTDNDDPQEYLKPGQMGLGDQIYQPLATFDDDSIVFSNTECRSLVNTGSNDGFVAHLSILLPEMPGVIAAIQPYVIL